MTQGISFRPGGCDYHAPASPSHPAAEAGRSVSPPPGAVPAGPAVHSPQARFAPAAAWRARLERTEQRERLLHEYQRAAQERGLRQSAINAHMACLRLLAEWCEVQMVRRQPMPSGVDSLQTLLRHRDESAVQETLARFRGDPVLHSGIREHIGDAVADFRRHDPAVAASAAAVLTQEDRAVLDAFGRLADAHPGNTDMTKAYYRDVLEEMAEWLQRQPHQPQIRSLSALQRLLCSDNPGARKAAEDLARQFTGSGAVPVRRGGATNQLRSIVDALGQSASNWPSLYLLPSHVSRQLERFLHAFRTAAIAQRAHLATVNNQVWILKKLSHWLDAQAAARHQAVRHDQADPHCLDSLDKLMRHKNPGDVKHVIDSFEKEPDNALAKSCINSAVVALRLLKPEIEARLAVFPGQQGQRPDSEVLDAFGRLADAHPGNTDMTKAYYRDVLEEMAGWLQRQPHQPQIRSLSALQRLLCSDDPGARKAAEDLAGQFTGSGAAPVRRGGPKDQLRSIVDALGQSARNQPLHLPPSGVSRQLEHLLHAYPLALSGRQAPLTGPVPATAAAEQASGSSGRGPDASARAGASETGALSSERHDAASASPAVAGPARAVQEMRLSGTRRPAGMPAQARMVRPRLDGHPPPFPGGEG